MDEILQTKISSFLYDILRYFIETTYISYPLLADYKSLDIFDPGHPFLSHPRVEEQSTGQTKPPLASPPYNTGQIHPFERRCNIHKSINVGS